MKGYAATQVLGLILSPHAVSHYLSRGYTQLSPSPVLWDRHTQGLLTSATSLWKSPPFSQAPAMQPRMLHCSEVTRVGGKKLDRGPEVLLLKGLVEPTQTLQGKAQAILIFSALVSSPHLIGVPSCGSRQGSAEASGRDHSE